MHRFADRVVLVQGAVSAIGQATLERLAAEGAALLCADSVPGPLEELAKRAAETGLDIETCIADGSDPTDVRSAVDAALERFGRLDALCNISSGRSWEELPEVCLRLRDWDRIVAGNLRAVFLMCREAIPHLLETRGSIVNVAATPSLGSHPWTSAYAASRSGVVGLTRLLAVEYAEQGLRVNAICTSACNSVEGEIAPRTGERKLLEERLPADDSGVAETAAAAVAFLLSADASSINGVDLNLDDPAV